VTEAVAIIGVCVRARLTKQVLVVDDSATTRSIIRKLLQASRFHLRVTEAEDGASAIELASKQRFDVVFLDCYMPGRDGFATLETLKRDHADIQVVMITGTKDYRIEDRARAGGAKEFLFKPFFAKGIDGILYRLFGLIGPKTI
jgi:CheY-like chemotaxis protein